MSKSNTQRDPGSLAIDHVADFCRRYPGETVTFYTRVGVRQNLAGFALTVTIPAGLILGDYQALSGDGGALPVVGLDGGASRLTWNVAGELPAGTVWEFQVQAQVAPTGQDVTLESRAVVALRVAGAEMVSAGETATVAISAQGRYLRHLPALYQKDELMGRFLMLFESFWTPIERQVDNIYLYFDPRMTPTDFLPWLASWFHLALDERWPEARRRRLLQAALSLYRKRGTRQGLQECLEIYTGEKSQIVEHRAGDLRLGPDTRLGPGVALGRGNQPHKFTVKLRLPPISGDENERARRESERRRAIEAIIEEQKPAHTDYVLQIETLPT
jgi:phage tail-like protein